MYRLLAFSILLAAQPALAQQSRLPDPLPNGTAPPELISLLPPGPGETIQVRELLITADQPLTTPTERKGNFRVHTDTGIHHLTADLEFLSGTDQNDEIVDSVATVRLTSRISVSQLPTQKASLASS